MAQASHAVSSVVVVTAERLAPYSYQESGVQRGILTAVLKELALRAGQPIQLKAMPWARALESARSAAGQLIYPLIFLPDQAQDYGWIGPVMDDTFAFVMRRSSLARWPDVTAMKSARIGVLRGALSDARLQSLDYRNLEFNNDHGALLAQVKRGHIDAWFSTRRMIHSTLLNTGFPEDDFVILDTESIQIYIGATSGMQANVDHWNRLLHNMREDGTLQRLLAEKAEQP